MEIISSTHKPIRSKSRYLYVARHSGIYTLSLIEEQMADYWVDRDRDIQFNARLAARFAILSTMVSEES